MSFLKVSFGSEESKHSGASPGNGKEIRFKRSNSPTREHLCEKTVCLSPLLALLISLTFVSLRFHFPHTAYSVVLPRAYLFLRQTRSSVAQGSQGLALNF